jgi:adenylate cyclase, class 2
MSHEIETKVLDINKTTIIKKLNALGAEHVQKTRLVVDWYRPRGTKEGEDQWYLRIRNHATGAFEVTWKPKSQHIGIIRKHKEINFLVQDKKSLTDLFMELGLECYAHQEKDRITYTYKNWQFDIDTYPQTPPFVEIEGSSEKHIKEAMSLLDIAGNRTWNDGERTLIQDVYHLDWCDMRF